MSRRIDLSDFPGEDARARFAGALAQAKLHPGTTLRVPPGQYRITSVLARETMNAAISGAYGENPEDVMFNPGFVFTEGLSFEGHQGTTLEAYGATLMIDGFMEPLCLKNCAQVRIEGLTIDHVRKPYSRGIIEEWHVCDAETGEGSIVVRFADAFPVDGRTIMPRYCAYDFSTGRFNLDMKMTGRAYLGGQRFRLEMKNMPERCLLGQEFYIWHAFHYRPAILIEDAKDITLREVTIHSQPGMGVVGHRSENITLDALRVIPAHGEHMSTNTDATHFTSCKGELSFRVCSFDGHGDDATNVHTFYHDISPVDGRTYEGSVSVKTHSLTLDYPDVGDQMELVDRRSLALRGQYRVLSVQPDPQRGRYLAQLDGDLPEDAAQRCFLSNVTRLPRLLFAGCTANNHWARSVLIKTRHAVVEDCAFTGSVLYAIHIAPEAWWHEGVSCRDITVRRNRFVHCGIGGHAETGGILVEMSSEERCGTPQQGIAILENIFDLPEVRHAISVSNAQDVTIRENVFLGDIEEPVVLKDCTRVTWEDSDCVGERK